MQSWHGPPVLSVRFDHRSTTVDGVQWSEKGAALSATVGLRDVSVVLVRLVFLVVLLLLIFLLFLCFLLLLLLLCLLLLAVIVELSDGFPHQQCVAIVYTRLEQSQHGTEHSE